MKNKDYIDILIEYLEKNGATYTIDENPIDAKLKRIKENIEKNKIMKTKLKYKP